MVNVRFLVHNRNEHQSVCSIIFYPLPILTFGALVVWSWLALIFGLVFFIGTLWTEKKSKGPKGRKLKVETYLASIVERTLC